MTLHSRARFVHALFAAALFACGAASGGVDEAGLPAQPEPDASPATDGGSGDVLPLLPPVQPAPRDERHRVPVLGAEVTSVACAADGSCYSAGTFVDTAHVGAFTLRSRGLADVFLARWDGARSVATRATSLGEPVWVLSVGSSGADAPPRVTVQDDVATVTLLGTTDGNVDCGKGPMPKWSGETFYVCVFAQLDGALVVGGTFPIVVAR